MLVLEQTMFKILLPFISRTNSCPYKKFKAYEAQSGIRRSIPEAFGHAPA